MIGEYDLSFCDESGLMTGHALARDVPSYLQGESSWEWGAVYHHLPRTPLVHRYSCYSSRHLRCLPLLSRPFWPKEEGHLDGDTRVPRTTSEHHRDWQPRVHGTLD